MNASVCKRFYVTGKVQGVFFRASAAREARRLGLKGWAINMDDGRVEVLAYGTADGVGEMERWLQRGSSMARVQQVDSRPEVPDQFAGLEDFRTG